MQPERELGLVKMQKAVILTTEDTGRIMAHTKQHAMIGSTSLDELHKMESTSNPSVSKTMPCNGQSEGRMLDLWGLSEHELGIHAGIPS